MHDVGDSRFGHWRCKTKGPVGATRRRASLDLRLKKATSSTNTKLNPLPSSMTFSAAMASSTHWVEMSTGRGLRWQLVMIHTLPPLDGLVHKPSVTVILCGDNATSPCGL